MALVACAGPGTSDTARCPEGEPLRGIYDPSRLEVLEECVWFSGTVVEVGTRDDGDVHIRLEADADMSRYLNVTNVNTGGMVVEIVPGQDLRPPVVGERLRILGTWVLDTHNDWNEIHPVWAITYGDGTTLASLPPAEPRYQGDEED